MNRWIPILAQAFPGQVQSSGKEFGPGDLSFLRFPTATPEQISWFFIVMMGIVLVAIGTLVAERGFQNWSERRPKRNTQKGDRLLRHLDPELHAVVERLTPFAGGGKTALLVQDVSVFEMAVHQMILAGQTHDLMGITKLRRHLHLTAMNPNIEVVSTRQLMADLPVRLVATVGTERVDLYCSLLEVNERFLLIDLPYQQETYEMLTEHPEVMLLYWRRSGERPEVPFRVKLEPLQAGQITAFRCQHALVSEEMAQRADFRLSVDWPLTYHFVARDQLVARKQTGQEVDLYKGEAKLIDLSQSGAAFLLEKPLAEGGYAQLNFFLRDAPIRVMMEVLVQTQREDGKYQVRGHFRGMNAETRGRLQQFLAREQVKRMDLKEAFVQKLVDVPAEESPEPTPNEDPFAGAISDATAAQAAAEESASAQRSRSQRGSSRTTVPPQHNPAPDAAASKK